MQPLYFSSSGRALFGWLHGAPHAASIGVVLCAPFGFEAMCAHRSLRSFAEEFAVRGIPALRFDYLGAGDSADLEPHEEQLAIWRDNILAAAQTLRTYTGVRQICLLGIRLGALLAQMAAEEVDAAQLIAIAPVLQGARYLRELELALWQSQATHVPAESTRSSDESQPRSGGSLDLGGFVLSEATIDALRRVDLARRSTPPAVMVVDRADLPGAQRWSRSLGESGVACDYLCSSEYASMMRSPQFATVPHAMIDRCVGWVATQMPAADPPIPSPRPPLDHMTLPVNAQGACERPVFFGSDVTLFGIVAEPPAREARRRGVILLNSASDPHIGSRRLHVRLARHWVERGYVVLRMDLAGLGDSATRSGRAANIPFPPEAIADIASAADWLREHYTLRDLTLLGLCSGAYHALRAAVAGVHVDRLLMVNPFSYRPHKLTTIDEIQLGEVVRAPDIYSARARSKESWKKLLTGRANLRRIARIYGRLAALALGSGLREAARRLHLPMPNDLGGELLRLTARGTRLVFVFAPGEAGQSLLRLEAGSALQRLGARCQMHVIEGADHDCARAAPRALLEQVLSEELYARPDAQTDITHTRPTASTTIAAA